MLETGLSQSNSSETSDKEDAVIVAIRKSHDIYLLKAIFEKYLIFLFVYCYNFFYT